MRFLGHQADDDYERTIDAFDIGLGLRRPPTNGESSAALLDLLRRGIPTIVCDVGTFAEVPDDAVLKIAWPGEDAGVAQLGAVLRSLVMNESGRKRVGFSAIEHIRQHHSWDRLIGLYRELCLSNRDRRDRPASSVRKGVA